MAERINRQWLLKKRPEGAITPDCFELAESPVSELGPNEILVKTVLISADPTQRGWAGSDTYLPAVELGTPMRALGLGQVVASTSRKFKVGDLVGGLLGWQDYAHINLMEENLIPPSVVPPLGAPELLMAFSVTGLTAYFGMLDIGKPQPGETVVVSAASGATGSIAAQLAKLRGARVIGIAGGPEKCERLIETFGLDAAIDYKNEDVAERVEALCPKGIDVYYDNVGGETLEAALQNLAYGARVVCCGMISGYHLLSESADPAQFYGVKNLFQLTGSSAKMQGFLLMDYVERTAEGFAMLLKWHNEGRLIQEIDLQHGFENVPASLMRLFEGKNVGKQLTKINDFPLPIKPNPIAKMAVKLAQTYYSWRLR